MTEQKKKLLRAKIALALYEEYGSSPSQELVDRYYRAAKIFYHAIIPAFFEKQKVKKQLSQLTLL